MTKKKSSVALFEVISKGGVKPSRDEVRVPDWAGRYVESAPAPEAAPGEQTPLPASPGPPGPVAPAADETPGRLTLSLNYVSCAAAAAGLLVLLGGAFWIGRVTAPAGPVRMAGVGPGGGRGGIGTDRTDVTRAPKRVPGKRYLVIQQLPGNSAQDLADARAIAKFCNDNNVAAEVWRTPRYYYVWALRAFDSYQDTLKPDAIRYARRIEKLGREYSRRAAGSGGALKRYDFRQRKGGKFQPHFKLYQGRK